MPIYEYVCDACGHELEALQAISDEPLRECPDCQESALRKKISAAAFRLKGGGWYETDFKNSRKRNLAGESAESGDSKKADAKAEAKPQSKGDSGKAAGSADSGATPSTPARAAVGGPPARAPGAGTPAWPAARCPGAGPPAPCGLPTRTPRAPQARNKCRCRAGGGTWPSRGEHWYHPLLLRSRHEDSPGPCAPTTADRLTTRCWTAR